MMKSHGGLCCGHSRGKNPLLEPGWTHAVGPMVSPPHPRSGEKPWPPGRGSCLDVAPAPTPHLDQPVLLLTFPLCCLHSSRESLTESIGHWRCFALWKQGHHLHHCTGDRFHCFPKSSSKNGIAEGHRTAQKKDYISLPCCGR